MTDDLSAGALLRAAREKQGLHIAALAAAIKVSPRKLDALEKDRWQELPDATFTRALAQTVCRTLKIDPKPILARLPAATSMSLEARDSGLNEPFRDRPGRDVPGLSAIAVRPMIWGAGVLMAAAIAVMFLPAGLWQDWTGPAKESESVVVVMPAASAPALSAASAPADVVSVASPVASPGAPPEAAATVPTLSSGSTIGSTSVAAAAPAVLVAPPAPVVPLVSAAGLLQLQTSAASWIEVRDARSAVLFSRIVRAGESVALDFAPPLRVTIGNAAVTRLSFRGQNVDLSGSTRDNVARLDLP